MVRLYLNKKSEKGKKQFLDVSFWSLTKSFVLSWLVIVGIIWGTIILIALLVAIIAAIIGI
jgi:hypothetical protein